VAEDQEERPRPRSTRRRSRRRRAVVAVLLLGGAGALSIWSERRPIARHFVDRELARRGVPARYRLAELGPGRQRLEGLVIGDPRSPDLTADWVETETVIGLTSVRLAGFRAGGVRLRARVTADGRVTMGAVDRLLPPPSGAPLRLPAVDLDLRDARMDLATPLGAAVVGLAGRGRLDRDFRGRATVKAARLGTADCRAGGVTARLAVRVADAAPRLTGPVGAATLACAGVRAARPGAVVDARLSPAFDRWRGTARLAGGEVAGPGATAAALAGTLAFDGTAAATGGRGELWLANARAGGASAARAGAGGTWNVGRGGARFDGTLHAAAASVPAGLARRAGVLAGTPPGGPVLAAARAADAALARFDAAARVRFRSDADGPGLRADALDARAATGARLRVAGGEGLEWRGGQGLRLAASLDLGGGGLPEVALRVRRAADGSVRGEGQAALPATADASLGLEAVRFASGAGGGTLDATVRLSGPFAGGRVDGLVLPVRSTWNDRGGWQVGPDCAAAAFRRLRASGLDLAPGRLTLCPLDGALLRGEGTRVTGGARLGPVRLAGRLGASPLELAAAAGGEVRVAGGAFALTGVAARLGPAERRSRLDVGELTGRLAGGPGGAFRGLGGQIGAVPLVLSDGAGDWRLEGGRLMLTGRLRVADAGAPARFEPMAVPDARLTLADGRVAAAGALTEPSSGTKVADVRIAHVLASGEGTADLTVPGLVFGDVLQPERLTRLTYGVIADVRGRVEGSGRIAWGPAGVSSTGAFRTAGLDFAAAVGPVTGVAGEIRFTDLLALESAPGQVATVASVNPGVPVTDGRIVYRTLKDARVDVASGRWPFAGGTLVLEPTLLDFAADRERRMTFRVAGVGAREFLQQFDFENIDATGVFDGVLPMVFDANGGRIEAGSLKVRDGGGTISYAGELGRRQLGFWGDLAFQSLRSLRYRSLAVEMNGPLAGEMVTDVRFAGVSQGAGVRSPFPVGLLVRRLQRLPLVFNVRIKAPFRGLLDSVQGFYDPSRLIRRNLPALMERQRARDAAVQPPSSEKKP